MFRNDKKKSLRDFLGVATIDEARRKLKIQGTAIEIYTRIARRQIVQDELKKKVIEREAKKLLIKSTARKLQNLLDQKKLILQTVVERPTEITKYNIHTSYKQPIKKFLGRRIKVYTYVDGKLINETELNVPSTLAGFNKWWGAIFWNFIINTNTNIIQNYTDIKIVLTPAVKLKVSMIQQRFAEGITNCMLTPIYDFCIEKMNEAKSESTEKKYRLLAVKVSKMTDKYPTGIPEGDIQKICNDLQISISIDLPFSHNHFIDCESVRKSLGKFKFINSRLDHLELNEIVNDTPTELEQHELQAIGEALYKTDEYMLFKKNKEGQYFSVQTLTDKYVARNPFREACLEFEEHYGLQYCKLDYINDPVVEFIKQGVHFNSAIQFNEETNEYSHIDMAKAYANFKKCKWYAGFVGKITDWRQTTKIVAPGYYRVKHFNFSGVRSPVFQFLGCYVDGNVYPSPEIAVLVKYGVVVDICEGAWGGSIDFDFSDEMINTKTNMVSWYALWTGQQFMFSDTKSFYMKGTEAYFSHMKSQNPACEITYYGQGEAKIEYPRKSGFNLPHIAGFITAYQRLGVIEQLMEMDLTKILKISTDGIFYEPHDIKLVNSFRVKETDGFGGADGFYCSNIDLGDYTITESKFRPNYKRELFLGAGGNGKTHYNLTDTGLQKICYIAPSWKLSSSKRREYFVGNSVLALAHHPTRKYDILRKYNVFALDEASQYSQETKNAIFEDFKLGKIIFMGDLGFQLPCFNGEPMTVEGFDNINTFNTNYRFKCPDQIRICEEVRKMITDDIPNEEINKYIISQYENVSEPVGYTPKDIILCSRTNCGLEDHPPSCNCNGKNYSAQWTKKYGDTKWKCKERTDTHYHGDIEICDEKPKGKWEARHGYTIHSVQGETYTETIYIDARNLFDKTMGYTAISRAEYAKQIKIIVN